MLFLAEVENYIRHQVISNKAGSVSFDSYDRFLRQILELFDMRQYKNEKLSNQNYKEQDTVMVPQATHGCVILQFAIIRR